MDPRPDGDLAFHRSVAAAARPGVDPVAAQTSRCAGFDRAARAGRRARLGRVDRATPNARRGPHGDRRGPVRGAGTGVVGRDAGGDASAGRGTPSVSTRRGTVEEPVAPSAQASAAARSRAAHPAPPFPPRAGPRLRRPGPGRPSSATPSPAICADTIDRPGRHDGPASRREAPSPGALTSDARTTGRRSSGGHAVAVIASLAMSVVVAAAVSLRCRSCWSPPPCCWAPAGRSRPRRRPRPRPTTRASSRSSRNAD